MIRNLKVLGLAVVAVLALSGGAASSALATPYTAPLAPTDLTGAQTEQQVFSGSGFSTKCTTATFAATQGTASATELSVTPTYTGCTTVGLTTHVNMNGCTYQFTEATILKPKEEWTIHAPHLRCPAGKVIELTITSGTSSICTMTIAEQTPTGGHIIVKRIGPFSYTLTITVTGIHYEFHGTSAGCFFQSLTTTKTDGKLEGGASVEGWNDPGPHTTNEEIGFE